MVIIYTSKNHIFFADFKNIFEISKNKFLRSSQCILWKTQNFDLKNLLRGMWHMFSIQFLKLFSILEIFFQNLNFLGLCGSFFEKTQFSYFFWKSSLGACGTCLVSNFWRPFRFWKYFFKIFIFFASGGHYKKMKKMTFLKFWVKKNGPKRPKN